MKNSSNYTYATVPTQFVKVGEVNFAYRSYGKNSGIPVIYLNHLAAVLDNCDPRIMDGIASENQIIVLDYRGVGASSGTAPLTIAAMAADVIAFVKALGFEKVDLLGLSLGGFVSQELLLQETNLVRKIILAGTGPRGGQGISNVTKLTYWDMFRGFLTLRDPKFYLFFTQTQNGKNAARHFLKRINERTQNRDTKISLKTFGIQLKAIHQWANQKPADLSVIKQPVLIVNGENDRMVPTSNSYDMANRFSNTQLIIYKDAGHGSIFQYYQEFVKSALIFLSE